MDSILLDLIKETKYFTYATDVLSGKQLACEYVKLACQRFFDFLENPDFDFRPKKVKKVIKFISLMKHWEGLFKGQLYILEPFQEFIIANIYGFYYKNTDKRVTRKVFLEMGRKQAKSSLSAAIAIYSVVCDGEAAAEVDLVANTTKQASILFKMIKNYFESLPGSNHLFKTYRQDIRFFPTNSIIQVLSSDANVQDGLNSHVFILDEFHASKTTEMYDVLKDSLGSRKNPLAIIITTSGFNIGGPCHNMHKVNIDILKGLKTDETLFTLIYTLDDGDDWRDPNVWIKSNPNLGVTVDTDFYKELVNQANNNPLLEVSVKTKLFNLWVQSSQTWISDKLITDSMQPLTYDDLAKQAYYCYQAIDLASVGDLTAMATMTYNEDTLLYYFKLEYFVPATALSEGENNFIYTLWFREGYLNVMPGNVQDYDFILKKLLEINKQIQIFKCCYDQWNATQYTINATGAGLNMIPFSLSLGSFNRPTKEFERLILGGKVVLDYNPITRWTFQNVALKEDYFENVKPVKGGSYENKIDGVIAILQSLGGKLYEEIPDLTVTT